MPWVTETGDDHEVQRDTAPMSVPLRLWSRWRALLIAEVQGTEIWVVHDGGEVRVPARSGEHASTLCEAMMMAEFATSLPISPWWLRWVRATLLRAAAWTNRRDPRWAQE